MTSYVASVAFETEICCNCGVAFAMTADFMQRRRNDGKWFYCPAGHGQHYTGPTEATKLKQELQRKEEMLSAERARAGRLAAERDGIAKAHRKMRTRVMNGVCPCCNRQFQNLLRHMRSEHAGEFSLRNLRTAFGMTQAQVAEEIGIQTTYVSLLENEKPVPVYAKERAENWIAMQDGKQ